MFYRTITGDRPVAVLIIILIALGIWMPSFLSDESLVTASGPDTMPLYSLLTSPLEGFPLLSRIIAFTVVVLEAFLLVRINAKFVLIQQRNFLSALFFIIITGHSMELLQLNPVMIASLFMILVLWIDFSAYRDEPDSYRFFEAGLMLGLGSLFYAPLSYMLAFIWIACAVQRPFYWREYFFPLAGLLIPNTVMFAIYFLTGRDIPQLLEILRSNLYLAQGWSGFEWTHWTFAGLLFLLILISSIFLLKVFQFRKIYIRDYFMVLFWLFLCASAVFILFSNFNLGMTAVIAIPVSFILTNYFINAKKNFPNKLLLYTLLAFMAFLTVSNLIRN